MKIIDILKQTKKEDRAGTFFEIIYGPDYWEDGWAYDADWNFDKGGKLIINFNDYYLGDCDLRFNPDGSFNGFYCEDWDGQLNYNIYFNRIQLWIQKGKSITQDLIEEVKHGS